MKILIIEDEPKTAAYLKKGLEENGFVIDLAANGEDGTHLALTAGYDLIILDVMMPVCDGWSVMADLRRHGLSAPVLFLTARDAVHDRVKFGAGRRRLSGQAVRLLRTSCQGPFDTATGRDQDSVDCQDCQFTN